MYQASSPQTCPVLQDLLREKKVQKQQKGRAAIVLESMQALGAFDNGLIHTLEGNESNDFLYLRRLFS